MPIDVWIATSYVIEFVQSLFVLNAEIFRIIAENETLAERTAENIYYLSGFLKYFSEVLRDTVNILAQNETLMRYSVGIWQKVATECNLRFWG